MIFVLCMCLVAHSLLLIIVVTSGRWIPWIRSVRRESSLLLKLIDCFEYWGGLLYPLTYLNINLIDWGSFFLCLKITMVQLGYSLLLGHFLWTCLFQGHHFLWTCLFQGHLQQGHTSDCKCWTCWSGFNFFSQLMKLLPTHLWKLLSISQLWLIS